MLDISVNFDDGLDLSLDEWDGLLVTEWLEADPGALVPASARLGEFQYAHENPGAWKHVKLPAGMSKDEALLRLQTEAGFERALEPRHLPGKHDQKTHGKGGGGKVQLSDESAKDLHTRLQEPDGGFTIDARTGDDVTRGFAVAAFKDRSKEIPVKNLTPDDLKSYVDSNSDLLSKPENKFGGWHDPETGHVWLDVSMVTTNKAKAIQKAKAENQIAIFDLSTFESIPTGGTGRSHRHLPGKHDQKTHGSGIGEAVAGSGTTVKSKSGTGKSAAGWARAENQRVEYPPGSGTMIDAKVWRQGGHRVADLDSGFSEKEVETTILPTINRLQKTNPVAGMLDVRLEPTIFRKGKALNGVTVIGTGQIKLSGIMAGRKLRSRGFHSPAGDGHSQSEYVLVHEWGHAISKPKSEAKPREALFATTSPLSNYGKTNAHEAYAEAFAEFWFTKGKSMTWSVQDYVREFGWTV